MSLLKRIEEDVELHGEVHMVVSEYDEEVELRLGTTDFDHNAGLISVTGPDHTLHLVADHVVSWYRPMEMLH